MMLNGRQKVGMAVLAVGVMALVADRMYVLPTSAPASDRAVSGAEKRLPTARGEDPAASEEASAVQTVTRKLEAAWSEKGLSFEAPRDLFSLPGSWGRDPDRRPTDRPAARGDADFIKTYKLEAIIVGEDGKHASINDRLFCLGDTLDDYTLVEIRSESVVFEREGRRIELWLERNR